jgi:hypothetical protein
MDKWDKALVVTLGVGFYPFFVGLGYIVYHIATWWGYTV